MDFLNFGYSNVDLTINARIIMTILAVVILVFVVELYFKMIPMLFLRIDRFTEPSEVEIVQS